MAIHSSKAQFSLAISKAQFSLATSKAQFSLATSKLNSYSQYQSPILIGNIQAQFSLVTSKAKFSLALLYQKEKSPRLSTLGKEKKYHVKMLPWQYSYEETH